MATAKIKLIKEGAKVPTKNLLSDAGWDLYYCGDEPIGILPGGREMIPTGITTILPQGYCALLWDRSGNAVKKGLTVLAGVIDQTYTGEWNVVLHNTDRKKQIVNPGDRIAQAVFQKVPKIEWEEVDSLEQTERGDKGFGSSGE